MKQKTKRSYDKICQICKESFVAGSNNAKCCSDPCKLKWRNKIDRKKRGPVPDVICSICKKSFSPVSSNAGYCYCSDKCKAKGAKLKDKERRNKAKAKRKPKIYNRTCEVCGEDFQTENHLLKFCPNKCQKEGRNKWRRDHTQKKKKEGICPHCYIRPLINDKSACGVCLALANKAHQKLKIERIKNNLCRECGVPATRGNMCEKHANEGVIRGQKYYNHHKEQKICTRCRNPLSELYTNFMCRNCLDFINQQTFKLKIEVMTHYGGGRCQCCSEKIIHFLSIDHINENGAEHRKEIGNRTGISFYSWLKTNNFPRRYQTMCHNCNTGKHINNGMCPHKKIIHQYSTEGWRSKKKILNIYGNSCRCCSETEPRFLTIDHINGGGYEHRRKLEISGSGHNFRVWLIRNNFPPGYQTLCQNCNQGKHINGGVCPHKI